MEVIVRNLDEVADLLLVFIENLRWRFLRTRYPALLACLLYSNATTPAVVATTSADAPKLAVVATDQLPTRTP